MSTSTSDVLEPELDSIVVTESGEDIARSPLQLFWRRLRRDKVAMTALTFIVVLVITAFIAPVIVSVAGTPGPRVQSSEALDVFGSPSGPSSAHPFGVDRIGRDIFSRTIYGSRVSLEVALIATGIAVFIGTIVGLLAGFYRGWVDTLLSRLTDVVLAFPILCWASASRRPAPAPRAAWRPDPARPPVVIMVIAVINWTYIARIVRGQVLSLREKEFVEAAARSGPRTPASSRARSSQPRGAADRLLISADPGQHPARGGAVVPRRGSRGRHALVGRDDLRGHEPVPRRLVVHALPWPGPPVHRARVQPRGRRVAGRTRPAAEVTAVTSPHLAVTQQRKDEVHV
jgi:ABC-type dipeptide/oligopeptide/nickel transport system permease subunit